jgi:hypothetical protein
MPDAADRPALTLVPDPDPFVPAAAAALLKAGFPAERIPWLQLPAAAERELIAAMSRPQISEEPNP